MTLGLVTRPDNAHSHVAAPGSGAVSNSTARVAVTLAASSCFGLGGQLMQLQKTTEAAASDATYKSELGGSACCH